MESLSETTWDIVIAGTGIRQSLLALALSRSGKKILHIDKNKFYGGPEAAFSLQEAEEWAGLSETHFDATSTIRPISLWTNPKTDKLGASRAYTLSLSPQLIYTQSSLLPSLVTSQLHKLLEFQAIGSWWIYSQPSSVPESGKVHDPEMIQEKTGDSDVKQHVQRRLQKLPSSREDVFSDDTFTAKDKRSMLKFLRSVMSEPSPEASSAQDVALSSTLSGHYGMSSSLHRPLLALTLSYKPPSEMHTDLAMSRIKRHMRSIGAFGAGFGAVAPKYGGTAEIAQVACRASAVGGAVYVLGRGPEKSSRVEIHQSESTQEELLELTLSDGEVIRARFLAGCADDLPVQISDLLTSDRSRIERIAHSINIVSTPMEHLFPPTSEFGPMPAAAVVVDFPQTSRPSSARDSNEKLGPIYMVAHSADSGECPAGQCIIHASTLSDSANDDILARAGLREGVSRLLAASASSNPDPEILWSLEYHAYGRPIGSDPEPMRSVISEKVMVFPASLLDLAFDDSILSSVKQMWKRVMGDEVQEDEFLRFEQRQPAEHD